MNNELNNNPNSENVTPEPDTVPEERKKIMYVPDEELLAYSRTKEALDKDAAGEINNDGKAAKKADGSHDPVSGDGTEKYGVFSKIVRFVIPLKSDGRKKIILKSVSLLAALVFICSAVYLSCYFIDLGKQNSKINNIRATYELNREDYTYNEDGQFSKFDVLKKQNSDIVGWLDIPGTEINNPVYQTSDNDYYISHDMNKEYNSYGALFLDYRCDIDPKSLSQNQIIYGHNMRYGAMFGTLNDYRSLDYYKANPVINFDSLYETRKYKIVAMMITNSSVDSTFGYDFTPYRSSFSSQDEFMLWIAQCRARSLIDTNIDVQAYDEVITLSTCCYDFDNARFVIVARLVREGEDAGVDTSSAAMNSDVIYSGEYYAKKKIPVPQVEPPVASVYGDTES